MVAFSRNIIYSAFSLLGTFMGVAGIYIFLGADFVAAVQVLDLRRRHSGLDSVCRHADASHYRCRNHQPRRRENSRADHHRRVRLSLDSRPFEVTPWVKAKEVVYAPTTAKIGDLFLIFYLLPFELASLVLLGSHDRRGRAVTQGDQRVAMSPNELSSYLIIGAILFALGLFTVLDPA